MWRLTLALTIPAVLFAPPLEAEPIMLAKLVVPSASAKHRPEPVVSTPQPQVRPASAPARVEMRVHKVLNSQAGPVVLLTDPAQTLTMPIWIGAAEARSIQIALDKYPVARPLSHDLMVALLRDLHAEVVDVEVSGMVGETFIGTAHLRTVHGKLLSVDARPSDLLALALRTAAPIFVAQDVLRVAKLEPARHISPRTQP